MKNKMKYLLVLQLFLMLYSFFGLFSKMAAKEEFLSGKFILYYGVVIGNLAVYAILWQQIIKNMSLITAYANKAVTVVWGIVWGRTFFQEPVTIHKLIGAAFIICGIILVVTDKEEKSD